MRVRRLFLGFRGDTSFLYFLSRGRVPSFSFQMYLMAFSTVSQI